MKVFGYIRVSTKRQIDGDGPERQREAIVKFCASKGWTIFGWYEEPISGTVDGFDRPKFAEMMAVAGPGTAQAVVVESGDRLARDLMVSELLLNEARKQGVQIYEAAAGSELTHSEDPTRVLIRQMLGAVAQWNKSIMVKRLSAARNRLKVSGGFMGGKIPWEERQPKEAEHIISMRKSNFTLDEIRDYFRRTQIKTPDGKSSKHWHKSTIAYICQRLSKMGKLPPLEKKKVDLEYITI